MSRKKRANVINLIGKLDYKSDKDGREVLSQSNDLVEGVRGYMIYGSS